jgi:hypothetical protein
MPNKCTINIIPTHSLCMCTISILIEEYRIQYFMSNNTHCPLFSVPRAPTSGRLYHITDCIVPITYLALSFLQFTASGQGSASSWEWYIQWYTNTFSGKFLEVHYREPSRTSLSRTFENLTLENLREHSWCRPLTMIRIAADWWLCRDVSLTDTTNSCVSSGLAIHKKTIVKNWI